VLEPGPRPRPGPRPPEAPDGEGASPPKRLCEAISALLGPWLQLMGGVVALRRLWSSRTLAVRAGRPGQGRRASHPHLRTFLRQRQGRHAKRHTRHLSPPPSLSSTSALRGNAPGGPADGEGPTESRRRRESPPTPGCCQIPAPGAQPNPGRRSGCRARPSPKEAERLDSI
jgi:hypothetical protein